MKNNPNESLLLKKYDQQKINQTELYVQDDSLVLKVNDIRTEIINNYSEIEKASKTILNYCIDNDISTPIAYHNLFFYIEIRLKLKLLFSSSQSIDELEKFGHNFNEIIKVLKQCTSINFGGFYFILRKIKDKNGNSIDFNKHHHLKYNKKLGCNNLIFDLKLSNKNKEIIREVIEWLDLHI